MLKIDQAFVNAFVNANFGLPIAHENLDYAPTGVAYVELLSNPNNVTPFSLADSNEADGLFKAILRYPPSKGAVPAKTKADEIMLAFKIGTQVCYSGICATVTGQSASNGAAEAGWYKIVVNIAYRSIFGR